MKRERVDELRKRKGCQSPALAGRKAKLERKGVGEGETEVCATSDGASLYRGRDHVLLRM